MSHIMLNRLSLCFLVVKQLPFLDRWLAVWIVAAMAVGVILGVFGDAQKPLNTAKVDKVPIALAVGLWGMMYPVLCKVRHDAPRAVQGEA
jgi:arsenite transporter